MLFIPPIPVLFGDIYFAFKKYKPTMLDYRKFLFPYVCYNSSRYNNFFIDNSNEIYNYSTVLFNNLICHRGIQQPDVFPSPQFYLQHLHSKLWQYHEIYNYNSIICNRSKMCQCSNSLKCISIHRRMNGINDCPNSDDENITSINHTISIDEIKPPEEESDIKLQNFREHISFQTICDRSTELLPILTDGRNETDETECEHWFCNNIYTRCNGAWNCLNGADEINCDLPSSSILNYLLDHHKCVSPDTNQFIYLPINKADDGKVDCLGATDEPTLCHKQNAIIYWHGFYCMNQSLKPCIPDVQLCYSLFVCQRNVKMQPYIKEPIIHFTLDGMKKSLEDQTKHIENEVRSSSPIITKSDQHQHHCHRGINLRICYYGDKCQYQNQRVSLSVRFQASPNSWQIPSAIVILLIDDDNNKQIIHSYEQITYLSTRDCKIKYNIYLLYSNRPKHQTKNYGIQINIYEKISLKYRGSLFFPSKFSFLPVYRLALIVNIPNDNINFESCSNNVCINGRCIRYLNNKDKTFCQCNVGWSGRYCTIQHSSICSSDSLDIGISSSTDQSICVCPIYKFGPRCLLNNMICQNDGLYIPMDEYMLSKKRFICICRKVYFGERCELEDTKIILSFEKSIIVPQSIFIHFIEVMNRDRPVRST
ncbi:unnamed protein product, partial [Adineta steineri]